MSSKKDFIDGLKGMELEDLQSKITEDSYRLKKLKFAHAVSPLENAATIKVLRRDIARAKTIMRERELNKTEENN